MQSQENVKVYKNILKDYFKEINNECRNFDYMVSTEEMQSMQ
jgi:hypothetical protein